MVIGLGYGQPFVRQNQFVHRTGGCDSHIQIIFKLCRIFQKTGLQLGGSCLCNFYAVTLFYVYKRCIYRNRLSGHRNFHLNYLVPYLTCVFLIKNITSSCLSLLYKVGSYRKRQNRGRTGLSIDFRAAAGGAGPYRLTRRQLRHLLFCQLCACRIGIRNGVCSQNRSRHCRRVICRRFIKRDIQERLIISSHGIVRSNISGGNGKFISCQSLPFILDFFRIIQLYIAMPQRFHTDISGSVIIRLREQIPVR